MTRAANGTPTAQQRSQFWLHHRQVNGKARIATHYTIETFEAIAKNFALGIGSAGRLQMPNLVIINNSVATFYAKWEA